MDPDGVGNTYGNINSLPWRTSSPRPKMALFLTSLSSSRIALVNVVYRWETNGSKTPSSGSKQTASTPTPKDFSAIVDFFFC